MSFGTRLKEKREALGITQPQLAKTLGVSQSAVGSWETDVNSPRATILYDLFEILHCDANYLLQDEIKELYKYLTTRKENQLKKKQAMVAVIGKILQIIYAVVTKNEEYKATRVFTGERLEQLKVA